MIRPVMTPRAAAVLALLSSAPACSDDATHPPEADSDGDPGSEDAAGADASAGDDGDGDDGGGSAGDDGGSDEAGDDGSSGDPEVVALSPREQLVRMSMALRGARPSLEELALVAEDPGVLADFTDAYLDDPAFAETIRELHNEAWLVQSERGLPVLQPVQDTTPVELGLSVSEGPLRLVQYIVTNDRPYTEVVTADYAVMDRDTAAVWNVAFDEGGPELQVTDQQPGPPPAGVLSDAAIWVRHRSDASNFHRGRANFVSSAFLCTDFLERDIEVDASIDLADPDAVNEAVTSNPSCVSCHQSLDGLASFFWGWRGAFNPLGMTSYPAVMWLPQAVGSWQQTTGRPPSYFGADGDDLASLGQLLADDPRFSLCAARRFYAFFHQVALADVPLSAAAELQATFIDSGFDAKALVRAIVLDDAFLVSHAEDEALAETTRGVRKARPSQLARLVDDLTGFSWQTNIDGPPYLQPQNYAGDIDLVRGSRFGFGVLAGGIDGTFVEQASDTINATTSLVLRGLAEQAAAHVVDGDFAQADPDARRLLTRVQPDDADQDAIVAQLVDLHLRLYGEEVAADDASVQDAWALFSGTAADSDPRHAWAVTLSAMLQDHRIIYY